MARSNTFSAIVIVALLTSALPADAQEAVPRESGTESSEPAQGVPERRAVPRGSRPQGDNPQTGTAVPRPARPAPPSRPPDARSGNPTPDRRTTVIVRPPYGRSYYPYLPGAGYPYYYPYGYGAFGLGYFYYDPYGWAAGPYSGGAGTYRAPSSWDMGELRIELSPRTAQVFVDGYYAGIVDDFDGAFQAVKLTEGPHRIEITLPGYDTVSFDVRITRGQKITYRGELHRLPW